MLNFIAKIQRKPEAVRRKMAITGAAIMTGAIVVLWLISISFRELPSVAREETASPFAALSDGIGAVLEDTKEALQEVTDAFSEDEENVPASHEPREINSSD